MNAHDPGGKVRYRVEESVKGAAMFSGPGDCYRTLLTRQWHGRPDSAGIPRYFVLWIGQNPSTADASFDDPTVNREIDFSMSWDFDGLVKTNICDFRSTKPEGLLAPGVTPCSKTNLPMIRNMAKFAGKIICAWGNLHRNIVPYAVEVESALRADGHKLWCLGLNAGGSPKHPLYLAATTPVVEFKDLRI